MLYAQLIRILIVDDSAFARKVVRELLATAPSIEVVGSARDGEDALEMLNSMEVDVVVCDLKMPRLDGAGFVRRQMMRRPLPILILSAAAHDEAEMIDALNQAERSGRPALIDVAVDPESSHHPASDY